MHRSRLLATWVGVCLAFMVQIAAYADSQMLLHSERSLYREVLVYESGHERCMCFTRHCRIGRQTCMDMRDPDRFLMNYPQMMMGALYIKPRPQSVLIIGLGGGSLPRVLTQLLPKSKIDVVEIDPAVVSVAKKYFDFKPAGNLAVIEMDGRVFVKRAIREQRHYDLIMLDAFDHEYIPEHLLTQEFLREVKTLLSPDGVLAANTFSSSRLYDHESVTYASVFGEFFNLRRENRVILATNASLPTLEQVKAASIAMAPQLEKFGVDPGRIVPLFSTRQDWNTKARLLTDQYSPANLLNR
ncbi:MAG: fused MFS/spermidine synthase [Steroidobacteraceae bacterium]